MGLWLVCASTHGLVVQIVESDKTRYVDCSHLVEEIESQRLDENGVKNRSKEKAPGVSHTDVHRNDWFANLLCCICTVAEVDLIFLYFIPSDTSRDTMALHHLPKRHIALKVMYFGQRYTLWEMLCNSFI